jgi:acyl-CoA dehydrogenase
VTDTQDTASIRDAVLRVCAPYDDSYCLERDRDGEYPIAFRNALVEAGWFGISLPAEFGGAGLGLRQAATLVETLCESGAAFSGFSVIAFNIFGTRVLVDFGTEEQKKRLLPELARGDHIGSIAVTEPDAGLDTTNITTFAVRRGDHYVVNGRKVWTSSAQRATKLLLLTRTTPRSEVKKPTEGMTLFFTDFDRARIEAHKIEKMGRNCVDSNQLFIDALEIPVADRIGEEGRGFDYIFHSLNPERVLLAAAAIGIGKAALNKAVRYAKERKVFGRFIGMNQGIQHPLAKNWMELEAASLMTYRAADLFDAGQSCGAEANSAKYLAAEAGFEACSQAVLTHGGFGYAKEYHVERYLRESMVPRIAPVSREMILCYVAERVLGLPKSY